MSVLKIVLPDRQGYEIEEAAKRVEYVAHDGETASVETILWAGKNWTLKNVVTDMENPHKWATVWLERKEE